MAHERERARRHPSTSPAVSPRHSINENLFSSPREHEASLRADMCTHLRLLASTYVLSPLSGRAGRSVRISIVAPQSWRQPMCIPRLSLCVLVVLTCPSNVNMRAILLRNKHPLTK